MIQVKVFRYLMWPFLLVAVALSSCRHNNAADPATGRKKIVTTTSLIKDAVLNITGNRVEVISLMGPGVDPHLYKATQGDLDKLLHADLIVYNGLHLEGKMSEVLEKLSHRKPVYAMASNLPDSLLRRVPGFENTFDPHIWFDVKLWSMAVSNLAEYLQEWDEQNAQHYKSNAAAYAAQLDSLHHWVIRSVDSIPPAQRVLITAHDAFGYFGRAYQAEVRGLQGISTLSEFGLRDITGLADFILSRKIKAVFVETSVPEKSIRALLDGCRQRGWNVQLGGSLYSDALGAEGTPEGTYIGMVKANVRTIVRALK
ncbi:MAG: manganese-binding lipoprotein MntA [Cyclobacteriaceae bacterium]|nr:MAG: manganese-binding lipoprotein MntA [Cyclobacteriaceae bacterium]